MNKKMLWLAITAIMLFLSTTAMATGTVTIYDVSPGALDYNYIRATDKNVVFVVMDVNADSPMSVEYHVRISVDNNSRTDPTPDTTIIADLNLGTPGKNLGYCEGAIGTTARGCSYPLNVSSLLDGNYYVDVNVWIQFRTGQATYDIIDDWNMDSNNSFYVDNNPPVCTITKSVNNLMRFVITNEDNPMDQGSKTTVYYKKKVSAAYSSTTFEKGTDYLETTLENTTNKYSCYATDTAGNVGLTANKDITWPDTSNIAIVQSVGGDGAVLTANIVSFAQQNPLFVGIAIVALWLMFGQKKKRRRRR